MLYRTAALTATLAVLALGWSLFVHMGPTTADVGGDLHLYLERTRSWLAGDGFYLDRQLHGPYPILVGDALYPPQTILLFLPFLVLPELLWWAIPLAVIGYVVWSYRPAPWTWPVMALLVAWPRSSLVLLWGNPTLWTVTAIAAAHRWPWAGPFVALKPTLGMFAVVGIRKRQWWIGAAVLALVSLPFLPMLPDYLAATFGARGRGGIFYSITDLVPCFIPLVAYVGRSLDQEHARPRTGQWRGRVGRWIQHLDNGLRDTSRHGTRNVQGLGDGL